MKLGQKLRSLRHDKGLILEDASKLANISRVYLSDIERGTTNPSIKIVNKIAKAYNLTLADLFRDVHAVQEEIKINYPTTLLDFIENSEYKSELDDNWKDLLAGIHLCGKYPSSKTDWVEIYLHLKRMLAPRKNLTIV